MSAGRDSTVVPLRRHARGVTHSAEGQEIEVTVALVLSCEHVSPQTRRWIADTDEFSFATSRHGAFIHCVGRENEHRIPDDLRAVMAFAKRRGFPWVRLDQDGPLFAALQTFTQ